MKTKLTLPAFTALFDTDEKCRAYLEKPIWGNTPVCRHCGSLKVGKYKGKSARSGLYQCNEKGCEKQFTVTVGTVFQDTHLPLTKWFLAMYLLSETTKGVSANWLKDAVGVTYKTAWYLAHRIRRLMGEEDVVLTGIVELDETYMLACIIICPASTCCATLARQYSVGTTGPATPLVGLQMCSKQARGGICRMRR